MSKNRRFAALACILLIILILVISLAVIHSGKNGRIYLYGEKHSSTIILEREFEIWNGYYHNKNMRHLFVELPYYTAEYLNIWMNERNDDILEEVFADLKNTNIDSDQVTAFYRKIKKYCPETVFHGTDVGYQYKTTGIRYLNYLADNGKSLTEEYSLALDAICQGDYYLDTGDDAYRETTMAENFAREFERLNKCDVMGIYGAAHTDPEAMDLKTGSVMSMAGQLKKRFGLRVKSKDLTGLI